MLVVQYEAGTLLLQVGQDFLAQELVLIALIGKVVIYSDPGTSPASTTSATDAGSSSTWGGPSTSRSCATSGCSCFGFGV